MSEANNPTYEPRGPDSFLLLYPFMWRDLDLKGVELLVFARTFGFCKNGGSFYESRAKTSSYLGISERSVTRAIGSLVERGILIDVDPTASLDGISTRTYRLSEQAEEASRLSTTDKLSPPDELSFHDGLTGEDPSGEGVTGWHLKSKAESKFE